MDATDHPGLLAALADALDGGAPVLPRAPGLSDAHLEPLLKAELPAGTAVVVRTSGSSGVPKSVALSAAALRSSAAATHEALGGPGQWLVTLPAHLISGLQMLVRSQLAGVPAHLLPGPFDPAALLQASTQMQHERRYVSLVPVQLARLLDLAEADETAAELLRGFAGVLVGGQATPLSMRQRAHELGVALRRSYGMTETSGGCVYDGVEIGDTRVRIRDGEVQIAGSCLALGYVGDEALTQHHFIMDAGTHWYRTGDAGALLGGMLTVTGRLDRVIISGGVNVSLDEVERVVRDLPGWHTAVALAAPHPEWGERVTLVRELPGAAGLSPHTEHASELDQTVGGGAGSGATFEEVSVTLKKQLGAAAVPLWVNEMAHLPRLEGGKPDLPAIERWVRELRRSFRTLGNR